MNQNQASPFGAMYQQRIQALIAQGSLSPLLVIEAAPGYWKSELTEDFLRRKKIPYAWLRLRSMDNWEFYFWEHFTGTCARLYPELSSELAKYDFPDTPQKISRFLKVFAGAQFHSHRRKTLVVDSYSVLHNKKILTFTKHLIESDLPGTCLVIINNLRTSLKAAFVDSNVHFSYIGEEILQMLPGEVQELYGMYGTQLSLEAAREVADQWDGWPAAIWLFACTDSGECAHENPFDQIRRFFEQGYYSRYSEEAKKLLVQLSLVEFFDDEMVRTLSNIPGSFEEVLGQSPFVHYNPEDNTYAFRHAYQAFLAPYQEQLGEADRQSIYLAAANMLEKKHKYADTLPLLLTCKKYGRVVKNIWMLLDIYAEHAKVRFLLNSMEQIPASYLEKHPRAKLLYIILLLLWARIDDVEAALGAMTRRFDRGELRDTELLGEVHFLQAHVSQIRGREDFVTHYRLASEYLPEGSRCWSEHPPILMNASLLMLPDNRPGALARVGRLYGESAPYIKILLKGKDAGLDRLFSLESSYFTYELDKAYVEALEIAYTTELNGQHELVLLTYYYLARIVMMKGSIAEAEKAVDFMARHIEQHNLQKPRGIYERMNGMLYIYTGAVEKAPAWLLEGTIQEGPVWEVARNGLVQACLLNQQGQNIRAVAALDQLEALDKTGGSWINTVYRLLFRAVAYHKLGEADSALDDLQAAYEMTHANDIITPFIECASGMRALLDMASARRPEAFEAEWLKAVHAKATSHAKRIAGQASPLLKPPPSI